MISRWFESSLDRELRETRELLARVNLETVAALGEGDSWLTDFFLRVIPRNLTESTRDEVFDLILSLLEEDGVFLLVDPERDISSMSRGERIDFRNFLRRKQRVIAKAKENLQLLEDLLSWLMQQLYGKLRETEGGVLDIPVCFFHDDFPGMIDRLVKNLLSNEIRESEMLAKEHWRLRNIIAPEGKPKWPGDTRESDPYELLDTYFLGSPLGQLCTRLISVELPESTRLEHTHIIGGSGHGKTELLKLLISADIPEVIAGNRSVLVMDSQGDLLGSLLRLGVFHPEYGELRDRLIIIDPHELEFPPALNLFALNTESADPLLREKQIQSAVSLYEYLFGSLLGAELTQRQGTLFAYLARLMMVIPGATIHTLRDVLEHGERYRPFMEKLSGSPREFFETRFFSLSFAPVKTQIVNRLWGILSTGTLDRMFSGKDMAIDLSEDLQTGKIILVNTAKELLKSEASSFFGKFILSLLSHAIIERAGVREKDRLPVYVYIDEAHEYLDGVLVSLFSQSRKYKVGLAVAHQNLDQLSAELRATIASSTSIKFAGGVSDKDARALAGDMKSSPYFLMSREKSETCTDFALFVRNQLPRAASCLIELGFVDDLRELEDFEVRELQHQNNQRYGRKFVEAVRELHKAPVQLPSPASREGLASLPAMPTTISPPNSPEIRVQGKGSPQHKYLQALAKKLGEEAGYRAEIEAAVPGGFIDVLLRRAGEVVAIEIAISNDPAYEAGNIEKCLSVDPTNILVVSPEKAHLEKIRKAALDRDIDLSLVSFADPEELSLRFLLRGSQEIQEPESETKVVKGYTVRVKRRDADGKDAAERRKRVAAVIAESLKKGK